MAQMSCLFPNTLLEAKMPSLLLNVRLVRQTSCLLRNIKRLLAQMYGDCHATTAPSQVIHPKKTINKPKSNEKQMKGKPARLQLRDKFHQDVTAFAGPKTSGCSEHAYRWP